MRIVLIDTAYLGDLVLATPLVRAAAEIATGGKIDVVTSPAGALVLENSPFVDDMLVFHKRQAASGLAGFRMVRSWLRQRGAQVALLPRRSLRSFFLAALAGVPRRIGFARGLSRYLLTDAVPFPEGLHQVERNLELLRPLPVDPAASGLPGHPVELFPSAEERRAVDDFLGRHRMDRPGSFYAMAPGSVWATKRWPVERYAAAAALLARDRPVLLLGGPAEVDLCRQLVTLVPEGLSHPILDTADRFSPAATVHLLSRAAVLICNDSGALHLGQAAATPTVALFGPTAPGLGLGPRGGRDVQVEVQGLSCRPCGRHGAARCPQSHWRCMLDLEVNCVVEAVAQATRGAA